MGNVETAGGNEAPTEERQPIREVHARDCEGLFVSAGSSTNATQSVSELPALSHVLATFIDTTNNLQASGGSRGPAHDHRVSFRPFLQLADTKPDSVTGEPPIGGQISTACEPAISSGDRQNSPERPLLESQRHMKCSSSLVGDSRRSTSSVADSLLSGVHRNPHLLDESADDSTAGCSSGLARVAQTQLPNFLQRAITAHRSRRRRSEAADNVEALKLLRHPLNRYVDERDRRM